MIIVNILQRELMNSAQRDTTLQKKKHVYLHSRTNKNCLVIQIQKAIWRKLEPLFSLNKMLYASKTEVTENALELERNSFRPDTKTTDSKSICMPWPLNVKQAAKIAIAQWKCAAFQIIIYPAEEKNLIGTNSILTWGTSRVGLPPHFIAIRTRR